MKLKVVNIVFVNIIVLLFLRDLVGGCPRGSRRRGGGGGGGCSPSNCILTQWSLWSGCSDRCGSSGIKTRSRSKTKDESCGGICPGPLSESKACNRNACKNGGTPIPGRCRCIAGWTGTCCESGMKMFVGKNIIGKKLKIHRTEMSSML